MDVQRGWLLIAALGMGLVWAEPEARGENPNKQRLPQGPITPTPPPPPPPTPSRQARGVLRMEKAYKSLSMDDAQQVITRAGYTVDSSGPAGTSGSRFIMNMRGVKVVMFLLGTGSSLQMYAGFSGLPCNAQAVNEWNHTKRFSKAYLDSDGDPVIESDLAIGGGLTVDAIAHHIRLFETSASQYQEFLRAQCRAAGTSM